MTAPATSSPPAAKPMSLAAEASLALDRAILAALGAFTGAMSLTTGDDMKALAAAGIAAGTAALISLGNSIRTFNTLS